LQVKIREYYFVKIKTTSMKTKHIFYILGLLVITISSCKPIYHCGEPRPQKNPVVSKRVNGLILERDNLCETVDLKSKEIDTLNKKVSALNKDVSGLNQSIKDLTNDKMSQSEQFDMAMKQKTDELNAKEKLLKQREKDLNELQKEISRRDSITKRLNDILHDALLGFNSDELSVEIKDGKVYVSMTDKLLFKSGSASVEAKGKEAIKVLADVLNKNQDIDILVEGHTDNVPIHTAIYQDNWDLSVARATSIVRILTTEYKITPTRLTASGRGEFSPRALNETTQGKARNRRTEIILSPKLGEIMKLLKTK
jgi:chemotaxis protein MotB